MKALPKGVFAIKLIMLKTKQLIMRIGFRINQNPMFYELLIILIGTIIMKIAR